MKIRYILVLLILCVFFYSFSNKYETIRIDNGSPKYVNSLVQSTDYLKLHINSPMTLTEYTANKTDKTGLIKFSSKDVICIPNKGQIIDTEGKLRPDIFYKASLNGIDLYLTNKGMSFVFFKYEDAPKNLAAGDRRIDEYSHPFDDDPMKDKIVKMYRMDLDIVGMNTNVKTLNEEQTTEYFNFYYAHCPDGITKVHGYRKVIFENVYDNIDLVYHSNKKGLKYDFIIKPGGDAADIKLKYKNDDEVYITEEGKIKALNPFGELETDVLYTYQSGGKVVESNYQKDTNGTISIITGDYDRTKELVIDPYIGATYYGGSSWESGETIMTDTDNNIFITGTTTSTNFPVQNPGGSYYYQGTNAGYDDIYILKFNSNGIRQWVTYYGGSRTDYGNSISTDKNNNILVTGSTLSSDFPLYNPGGNTYFQDTIGGSVYLGDVFILKFSSFGVRLWSTYYGGNNDDEGTSINTDGNNNILITGKTVSADFPLKNPGGGAYFQDSGGGTNFWIAFILKFDSNGVIKWATYYGESNAGEAGLSITTESNNNILITGFATGDNFPVYDPGSGAYFQGTNNGNYDAFILKFTSNGIRLWATYYGGSGSIQYGWDFGTSITSDENNNILISGHTSSLDFPLLNPGGGAYFQGTHAGGITDAFILKFDSGSIRQWATFYGGNDYDHGYSIATDVNNNILVTGETWSTNFPVQNPGGGAFFQSSNSGYREAFILKFNSSGIRKWATYYGGHVDDGGNSITADMNNNILVTGNTLSLNLPLYNPGGGAYFQGSHGGDVDAFILGFDSSGAIGINAQSTSVPEKYNLYQNYPNPFNPTTNIKFDIRESMHTKLIVYDLLGKVIAILVNEKLSAGCYEVEWNASDYTSGVYFYKIITDSFVDVKKMVLVK